MYSLTIEPIGQTIPIAPGQTVLDACLRNGVWLPHACCHGLCATCKVQVVDGEVDQGDASGFALMDFERDNGQCLACCATAQSDLVIEADIEEDADAEGLPLADYRAEVVATRADADHPRHLAEAEGRPAHRVPGRPVPEPAGAGLRPAPCLLACQQARR